MEHKLLIADNIILWFYAGRHFGFWISQRREWPIHSFMTIYRKFTGYGNLLIKIPSAKIAVVSPARRRDFLTLI